MRQRPKVRIASEQPKVVFDDQGCNPQVIGWNRRTLRSQLPIQTGVPAGGRFAREENPNTLLREEEMEDAFVLGAFGPGGKARAQLRESDERHENELRSSEDRHHFGDAVAEIAVAVGIEGDVQRHNSGSMRR